MSKEAAAKLKRRANRIIKWLRRFVVLSVLAIAVMAWAYNTYVINNPGAHISDRHIQGLLTQDSPVYYRDGKTVMSSITYQNSAEDLNHRYYIAYDELPKHWINAIISMEDQHYWTHHGVEPIGILKAVLRNLRGQRSGGSTLTQQTAKNLFNRDQFQRQSAEALARVLQGETEEPEMTPTVRFYAKLWAKLWEAVNALRLDYHFSKEQLLEYYANQFQVHGTGRGIGVASKYFFNKTPQELSLLESAYLAAIVKGPNNYNPFTKKTAETREETLKKSIGRTQTVLNRMLAEGYITVAQRDAIYHEELPFNRGFFRYDHSIIYDLLQEEFESSAIQTALNAANITNISTEGLHIVTTIDKTLQERSEYALRQHLTSLSGRLGDTTSAAPLRRPSGLLPQLNTALEPFHFYEGVIAKKESKQITVNIGGQSCVVDASGLDRSARNLKTSRAKLLKRLPVHGRLLVSMRDSKICDIELDGMLQGGLLATHKGEIVAIVGGRKNKYFNRATQAKLQLGSVWKTVIYAAAMQLGWAATDRLDNYHSAFVYSGGWYFPKGHGKTPPKAMSILWAGTHSENRASVWLLYHLTDRLSVEKIEQLSEQLGLFQRDDETKQNYRKRMQSKDYGVNSSNAWRETVAFQRAKRALYEQLPEGEEKLHLMSLLHSQPAIMRLGKAQAPKARSSSKHNLSVLEFNVRGVTQRWKNCSSKYSGVQFSSRIENGLPILAELLENARPQMSPELRWNEEHQRVECGQTEAPPLSWEIIEQFSVENGKQPELWIDGKLSSSTIELLTEEQQKFSAIYSTLEPYDREFLLHHPDFIRLLNMRYVSHLADSLGVETPLRNVLSMTLGASEITLVELNLLYGGILNGEQHIVEGLGRPAVIHRIVDDSGKIIYELTPKQVESVDPIVGHQVANILYNVVQNGTGRRAKGKIQINGQDVPALGKTGTTNDYKRAVFSGIIPKEYAGKWSVKDGIVLSAYVGYDKEKPMKKRSVRSIDGSKGGLPIWLEAAKAIADAGLVGALESPVEWGPPDGFVSQTDALNEKETSNWYYTEDNPFFAQRLHRIYAPIGQPKELLRIDSETEELEETEKEGVIPMTPPRFPDKEMQAPKKESSILDWLFGP